MRLHFRPGVRFLTSLLRSLVWHRQAFLAGIATGLVLLVAALVVYRTQRPLAVKLADRQSVRVTGPLSLGFGQDVKPGFKVALEPQIAGSWQQESTVLGVSGVSFRPQQRFEAGRTYTVRIRQLKRSLTGAVLPDIIRTFKAQSPAAIASASPAVDAKAVGVKPRFTIKLASANRGVRQLQASLSPAIPLKLVSSDDQTFVWEPQTPLKQSTSYTFVLEDTYQSQPAQRRLTSIPFTTVSEPVITAARTGGYVTPGQTIDITFDQPMETTDSAFHFDVGGKGHWTDDHTYRYTPDALKPGTTYHYKIQAGLKSKAGGVLETDRPYQFATNGAVMASLGTGGTVSVRSALRVSFDQPVNHASAESRFSISPAAAGKFAWSGNTMTFTPDGLSHQTTYNYGIAAGVTPVWGLPGLAASRSFVTETQVVKLGVPAYKQAYGRSCELSSLRMALSYRGIKVSDWDILMRVGYNPRARDTTNNFWDNPNQMFVGRVDTVSWSQGYGVHAGPLAAAARSYGRNATAHFGINAAFIAGHIHAGNPVIFYGHISPPKPDSWNSPSGVVQTTTSMHARIVYGVVGRPDAPTGFHIIDPWTGAKEYWSAGQLITNMNDAYPTSNQAVVVY